MTPAAALALGTTTGFALGLAYFGGLLWTVRRLPGSRQPWLLAGASFFVRALVAVGVLLLLTRTGSVAATASSLLGFVAARVALTRGTATRPAGAEE